MSLIRIQKVLSYSGKCSRRAAEKYLLDGLISVNGLVVKTLGTKVDPDIDTVFFKGCKIIFNKKNVYIALNKPKGYITSCNQFNRKIVVDLIKTSYRLFPVGRLDKDSTGLLLMTNDGRIHHRLSHPSFEHEKEYFVEALKPISNRSLSLIRNGMMLSGKMTRTAKVFRISSREFKVILLEGRNRQIRRMLEQLGNNVLVLKRIRVVNIKIGELNEGAWRYLLPKEINMLMKHLKLHL